MTRSFEFRLAVVGFLFGLIVALQSFLGTSGNSEHGQPAFGRGNERVLAAPAAVASSVIQPVYNPPSGARVAQFELLALDQSDRARQVLHSIPDLANRVNSVQWLLDAPRRESESDFHLSPPEKEKHKRFAEAQLHKLLPALFEQLLSDATQIQTVTSVGDLELGDRLVDSLLRIAALHESHDERDLADKVAKAAGDESLRLARLAPPDLVHPKSGRLTPAEDPAAKGASQGNPRWLAMLWPVLSSAFCFVLAQASRPVLEVLEAAGRALVGRAVSNTLHNADVTKALGLPERNDTPAKS